MHAYVQYMVMDPWCASSYVDRPLVARPRAACSNFRMPYLRFLVQATVQMNFFHLPATRKSFCVHSRWHYSNWQLCSIIQISTFPCALISILRWTRNQRASVCARQSDKFNKVVHRMYQVTTGVVCELNLFRFDHSTSEVQAMLRLPSPDSG